MLSIDQRLRRAIEKDDRSLRAIADAADVPYMSLWAWFNHRQEKLDFVQAEKVFRELTGKGFGG